MKKQMMHTIEGQGRTVGMLLTVILALLMVMPAFASTMVPLKGDFAGGSMIGDFEFPFLNIDAQAEGNATHLGGFQVDIPHQLNVTNNSLAGNYIFTAADGDQVYADFTGQATPAAEPGYLEIAIEATITGGDGRFTDATGSFTADVVVEQATGNVWGSFDGLISQP